ncbi:MAG: 1-(5-phosphoribosyl)-5-[(5-phosphoribosylamino)methylideneamino]imidazole-4-carboxamide isomerase [Spirochaetales bacterium]|nr:1-(5-phosphoribosyl)-5-[(5-phosphoribosylamino)methylideneamino]imidazole-4-carboxamide isomerase [Spirochaetales bacterium]
MLIIPAIDLIDGKCVRLVRGEYDSSTQYSAHPAEIAQEFEAAGAKLIHIIDLDGAKGSSSENRKHIRNIRKHITTAKIEVGGGVRTEEDIEELIDCGVDRIIIGTALVKEPERVAEWIGKYGFYAVAGIDAKDREVKVQGWMDGSGINDKDLVKKLPDMGFREIIYTNIAQDGTLAGPDIDSTNDIAKASKLPIILSGGIGEASHIKDVEKNRHKNICGVIIGKAIYEHKLSLSEIINKYQPTDTLVGSY